MATDATCPAPEGELSKAAVALEEAPRPIKGQQVSDPQVVSATALTWSIVNNLTDVNGAGGARHRARRRHVPALQPAGTCTCGMHPGATRPMPLPAGSLFASCNYTAEALAAGQMCDEGRWQERSEGTPLALPPTSWRWPLQVVRSPSYPCPLPTGLVCCYVIQSVEKEHLVPDGGGVCVRPGDCPVTRERRPGRRPERRP